MSQLTHASVTAEGPIEALKVHRKSILAATIALAAVALFAGRLMQQSESSAQLLITPLPPQNLDSQSTPASVSEELELILAPPLDVRTAAMLCKSDESLQITLDRLRANGALQMKLDSIDQLERILSFGITVTKETPREILYSRILRLTASARDPGDARIVVNEWAEVCVELGRRFWNADQSPLKEAFQEEERRALSNLRAAEDAYEKFQLSTNAELLESSFEKSVELATDMEVRLANLLIEISESDAVRSSLQKQEKDEERKVTLQWRLPAELVGAIGGLLGGDESLGRSSEAVIDIERINEIHQTISKELSLASSTTEGKSASRTRLESELATLRLELERIQTDYARARREERLLVREREIQEAVYRDVSLKRRLAELASDIQHAPMQLFSSGARREDPGYLLPLIAAVVGAAHGFIISWLVAYWLYARPLEAGKP